jgi:hypothetical protein
MSQYLTGLLNSGLVFGENRNDMISETYDIQNQNMPNTGLHDFEGTIIGGVMMTNFARTAHMKIDSLKDELERKANYPLDTRKAIEDEIAAETKKYKEIFFNKLLSQTVYEIEKNFIDKSTDQQIEEFVKDNVFDFCPRSLKVVLRSFEKIFLMTDFREKKRITAKLSKSTHSYFSFDTVPSFKKFSSYYSDMFSKPDGINPYYPPYFVYPRLAYITDVENQVFVTPNLPVTFNKRHFHPSNTFIYKEQ